MEYWDLYTKTREKTNKKHIRGQEMPVNLYHNVVHVWIKNKEGKYLLSQRSKDSYRSPLMWECTCGSVLSEESSIDAAIREVYEETGLRLRKEDGSLVLSFRRDTVGGKRLNDFIDVYLFNTDGNYSLESATTSEVNACKWVSCFEISLMFIKKEMISTQKYILELLDLFEKGSFYD